MDSLKQKVRLEMRIEQVSNALPVAVQAGTEPRGGTQHSRLREPVLPVSPLGFSAVLDYLCPDSLP